MSFFQPFSITPSNRVIRFTTADYLGAVPVLGAVVGLPRMVYACFSSDHQNARDNLIFGFVNCVPGLNSSLSVKPSMKVFDFIPYFEMIFTIPISELQDPIYPEPNEIAKVGDLHSLYGSYVCIKSDGELYGPVYFKDGALLAQPDLVLRGGKMYGQSKGMTFYANFPMRTKKIPEAGVLRDGEKINIPEDLWHHIAKHPQLAEQIFYIPNIVTFVEESNRIVIWC